MADTELEKTNSTESNKSTDANDELTAEQRKRIEENRQKALDLKRKRSQSKASTSTPNPILEKKTVPATSKLVDTGGGFLLDENELLEEKNKKIRIAEPPRPYIPPNQPTCLECQKDFGESYLLDKFDYSVCDDCREPKGKHALITKTEAKKNYILTDVDLEQRGTPLKFILGKNPHNSRWNDMKLYLLLQVEKRALEIWGSEENLLEELDKREAKRNASKQKSYQKKMKALKMSIRSSLYTRSLTESHTHEFDEETYNSDDDSYTHTCVSCGFKETYEKM